MSQTKQGQKIEMLEFAASSNSLQAKLMALDRTKKSLRRCCDTFGNLLICEHKLKSQVESNCEINHHLRLMHAIKCSIEKMR